jgi:hypothetical protein
MKTKKYLIAFVVAFCISACDDSGDSNETSSSTVDRVAAQQALDANIALWQRSSMASYQYTYLQQCFCPLRGDIVVTVVNGQVTEAFRLRDGTYLSAQEIGGVFPIEGLFNKIQESINRNVYSLKVTYNATLGYPESIAIDQDARLVDDEVTYTVRDLL